MKNKKIILLVALIISLCFFVSCSGGDGQNGANIHTADNIAPASDAAVAHVKVCFDIENIGTFTVETYPEHAPESVSHFLKLVSMGYYDGMSFEKLIPGEKIVSSTLTALSSGECKETVTGEFASNGYSNDLSMTRGTLCFNYLPGEYNSATSQFMILLGDLPAMEGKYAAFAKIIDGTAVFDAISSRQVYTDGKPVLPIVMKKVYVKE